VRPTALLTARPPQALIRALLRAYPNGASKRVMQGTTYLWPWGHTALDLAVLHNWPADIVAAVRYYNVTIAPLHTAHPYRPRWFCSSPWSRHQVIAAWPLGACTFDPSTPAQVRGGKSVCLPVQYKDRSITLC
jgi:hypothetical protein